ncbi:hypothetical protein K0U91_02150 [Chryseobacterium chendengshani]|uniref:hypothetical protein n=1 Tax=Chryseobacterium sp. LJ668 TaxID=2864040 RepID=UPI001C688A6F|nr:hypothetical protein [Chryseobacterium sp. LJ668]MBW8524026.1 hypothetical protein [Chryseobacterium sp. LJ668]QYK16963.1 hypothetical protein K0U91_02150 [Chryseobacterium sp. LJ668]
MRAKFPKFFRENCLDFFLFNFLIVLPSIRFFDKILSIPIFVIYFIVANIIYIFRTKISNLKIFRYKWWILFIVVSTVLNCIIYPKVDDRKNSGKGSTGDDAIILAAQTLKTTGKLYDVYIDENTPISPGPGWVLINSGFVLLDLYVFFSPFYLLILFLVLRKYVFNDKELNMFALFTGITLVFWELLFNGHDILPFSLSFLIISIVIFYKSHDKSSLWQFIVLGFLLGILSTSRIVFIFLPFLFSFLVMNLNRKKGVILLIVSLSVNLFFNIYFYSINTRFQPLHLFNKGLGILGKEVFIFLLLLGCLGFFFFTRLKSYQLILFEKRVFIILGMFFFPIAYIDLIRIDFQFSVWEGANYLMPLLGFYILQTISNMNFEIK